METKVREKRGLAAIFALCPKRHALLLLSAALIALHLLTRRNAALMSFLSQKAVRPIHRALGQLNAHVPFSVAELLLAAAVIAALVYIMYQLVQFFRRAERGKRLYRTLVTLISAVCSVYALFCLLWGVYYYGEDFAAENGFSAEPVSVEQLASVLFRPGSYRYKIGQLILPPSHLRSNMRYRIRRSEQRADFPVIPVMYDNVVQSIHLVKPSLYN